MTRFQLLMAQMTNNTNLATPIHFLQKNVCRPKQVGRAGINNSFIFFTFRVVGLVLLVSGHVLLGFLMTNP